MLRKIFEDFGLCLGCFGRVSSLAFLRSSTRHQTRHEGTGRLQQTNALPVPIKTGLSWRLLRAQDASKTLPRRLLISKTRHDAAKTPQDAPRCPQDAPKTPQEAPRGAQEASKTFPNPPKIYTYVENLENQKSLKNQWKINDFQGFGDHFSEVTSIVFRLAFMGYTQDVPRRSQDVLRRPQDAPKTPQDAPWRLQDGPKTPPRRSQDAPRRLQERKIRGSIWDRKAISSGIASRPRFWRVLGSIFEGFGMDFGRC